MKKKLVVLLMAATLAFSAVGCGNSTLSNEYITVTQYEKLKIPNLPGLEITDDMVEQTIQTALYNNMTKTPVEDRAAKDGDTVLIDYVGTVDGVEFEGGKAEKSKLKLGSGTFIGPSGDYKGFEEQVVGHNIGDEFDIMVQFPEEYPSEDLKGQPAQFHIVLHEIFIEEMPELNDEYVKTVSEKSKTVDEYRKEIKKKLEEQNSSQIEMQKAYLVLDSLLEKVEVKELPEEEIEERLTAADEYYKDIAKKSNLEFAEFCQQYFNMTEEEYTTTLREVTEDTLKKELACYLIAEEKNLIPSDKEIHDLTEQLATESGFASAEEFLEMVSEEEVKSAIVQDEVGKYLAKSCVIVDQNIPAEGAR